MTTSVKTINKDELKKKMDNGEAIQIINVLPKEAIAQGMIKGSVNIPLDELDQRLNEIDRSKEAIVYCKDKDCQASPKAAEELSRKGFNVRDYEGGINEWKMAGFPLDT